MSLILALGSFLSLCGCSSITEINQRSIVHAVGVDRATEGFEVSLQIFSPTETGSDTPVNISSANTKVVSASGKTIYDAVKNCEYLLGGEVFMGHNKFIIFGSSLYDEDMGVLLDWFRKENENYLGVTVAYAQKSAKDILNVQLTDGASAVENMEQVQEYASSYGITAKGDLLLLYNSLSLQTKSGLLPIFSVVKQEAEETLQETGEDTQYLEITGTAVLKNGKMAGCLEKDEIAGVLWVCGDMEKNMVNVEFEGRKFNLELEETSTKTSLDIKDGVVIISVKIKAEARIVDELDDKTKAQVSRLAQEKILSDCQLSVERTVDEIGTDVLGIEKLLKYYEPYVFRNYQQNFSDIISAVNFDVTAQVKVAN